MESIDIDGYTVYNLIKGNLKIEYTNREKTIMNKLTKITGVAMLSIGLLAGCQSKEEKALQGTWETRGAIETLTFDKNTMTREYIDGSGGIKDFEVKDVKDNGDFTLVEKSKKSNGDSFDGDTEYLFKFSGDKEKLFMLHSDKYYTKKHD